MQSALTTEPVAGVLARLWTEAGVTDALLRDRIGAMPPDELRAMMSDPDADYRAFYHRAADLHLAVSPTTGTLLYMVARSLRARAIVEFGTSFGVSTIYLAAALRDNGGGVVVGTELEPAKIAQARANLAAAGLADLVDLREGDALETLARDLPAQVDLVLLDGHKALYPHVLDLVAPRLRPGSWLIADNADASPAYLARVRAPGGGYLSVPFGDDVEASIAL